MILVQESDFNPAELTAGLRARSAGKAGALVSFTGYVRDYTENTATRTLFLEHYPGMCEREISVICATAQDRWTIFEPVVVHRVGALHYTEQIVFVAVASPHRGDAFDACRYIIDALKTRAPFWKRETLATGESVWVQQQESDAAQAAQWEIGNASPKNCHHEPD